MNADKPDFEAIGQSHFLDGINTPNLLDINSNFSIEDDTLIGTASADLTLFFGKIFSKKTSEINVRAASAINIENTPTACVIALSTSESPGITLNTGAELMGENCEMHVHYANSNPALSTGINVTTDFSRICVAGTNITNNAGLDVETGCDVIPDPYLNAVPVPDTAPCEPSQNINSGNVTLNPGTYCNGLNFNNHGGTVTFNPGLYVIQNGDWNVSSAEWLGDGVTFYLKGNSRINFNSTIDANLIAPTSGDYAGLLLTEEPSLSNSTLAFNANNFDTEGAIYLPSKEIIFNTGGNFQIENSQIIGRRVTFNNADINITIPNTGASGTSGTVIVRLVE